MKCGICNQEFDTFRKIARHIKDKHKMSTKDYYDKFINSGKEHICPICGNDNKFKNINLGYHTTCSHICHTKYQYLTMSKEDRNITNDKRKNSWLNKDMDAYKSLQHNVQIERWKNVSDEQRVEIGQKISASWQNHTNEERIIIQKNQSKAAKIRISNLSEKDKLDRNQKISNSLKEMYDNMSDEERENMLVKIHNRLHNFSDEKKAIINEKRKQTFRNKTAEEWKKIKEKEIITRRKNNTLNTSKSEDRCYDLLCTKYNNVIRSYKSKQYPYFCDFYITELDLYIECHFHWTHGTHPYTNSKEDNVIVNNWKNKGTRYYNTAIYVWTILDVKKLNCAKQNNLNYLAFYNETDFKKWFYS